MGKRKTRRRSSRRNKKGGLGKQFGKSLLTWYGKNNTGKNDGDVKSKNKVDLVEGELPENIKNFEAVSWHQSCKSTIFGNMPMGIPEPRDQEEYTYNKYPEIFNTLKLADHTYLQELLPGVKFNAYYVSYQKNSCYGGERFELLQWDDVNVESNDTELGVIVLSDKDWGKGKEVKISYGDLKGDGMVTVNAFGQELKMNENSILVPDPTKGRRNTMGGKKKRRKRTKRKSRKKRKRTKKRRRRRR